MYFNPHNGRRLTVGWHATLAAYLTRAALPRAELVAIITDTGLVKKTADNIILAAVAQRVLSKTGSYRKQNDTRLYRLVPPEDRTEPGQAWFAPCCPQASNLTSDLVDLIRSAGSLQLYRAVKQLAPIHGSAASHAALRQLAEQMSEVTITGEGAYATMTYSLSATD